MEYEEAFLFSLFLTVLTETPVVFLIMRYLYKDKVIKTSKVVAVSFLASALTLPYLWFVLPRFIPDWNIYFILGESLVIVIESLVYFHLFRLKPLNAFILSLLANAVSMSLGLFIKL
ncbi:MAG: hypothetical protein PHW52_02620 [Candidatus Pacebacteria bacterium]|nr:hypothetical protein [Candidatus Paceibacterota bacterium]